MNICLAIDIFKRFPAHSSLINVLERSSPDIDTDKANVRLFLQRSSQWVCPASIGILRNSPLFNVHQKKS